MSAKEQFESMQYKVNLKGENIENKIKVNLDIKGVQDLDKYINDLKEEINKLNHIIDKQDRDIVVLSKSNKELKSKFENILKDLKYVLVQVLGAFEKGWCIDFNFSNIRKRYNIGDKDE